RSHMPVQEPVAEIHGNTLPGQLAAILEIRNAVDIVGRKAGPHLDAKIPDGYKFQLEFLTDCPIATAAFGKSSGRLALEFAFAGAADIGADHEAKQMLGIDAFGVHAIRGERRKTHDRGSKRFCIDRHSHSEIVDRWQATAWLTDRSLSQ